MRAKCSPPDLAQVGHQVAVEGFGTRGKGGEIALAHLEEVGGIGSVFSPPGTHAAVEEGEGPDVVVGEENVPRYRVRCYISE